MAPIRHGVVTPNCKYITWDNWFVGQELKFKFSLRSELNWQRYREITKMAHLRHGVVTPNYKKTSWDFWFVAQELKFQVS